MDQEKKDAQQESFGGGLWAAGIFFVALVFLLIMLGGYIREWEWTGLPERTLWNWLTLLIVPAVIAGGGLWFNRQQQDRGLELENERAQDEALEAYLDQMSQMIADKDRPLHRSEPGDPLSLVAQVRTRTVLRRLNPRRKRYVVQFLSDAELVQSSNIDAVLNMLANTENPETLPSAASILKPSRSIVVSLEQADLDGVDLHYLRLLNADIRYAEMRRANLSNASLQNAKLVESNMEGAILHGANLSGAKLASACLRDADLSDADLQHANLRGADLQHANLRGADLYKANMAKTQLQGADLTGVKNFPKNLKEANMVDAKEIEGSKEFLTGATSRYTAQRIALTGATMPNGKLYEVWLKDKESGGLDEDNSSPS